MHFKAQQLYKDWLPLPDQHVSKVADPQSILLNHNTEGNGGQQDTAKMALACFHLIISVLNRDSKQLFK